ncbi:MAG: ABC transporter substrate-binding protein [Treponema sp.]|nr:ABC transporter substrate-binding protein [Treponema sp.]
MLKKIICLFSCFSLFLPLFAQKSSIRLGVLKGISCLPCAYLIENKEKLAVQNMSFQIFDSAQAQLPRLLRGELDMGFLAPEDAAKVFTEGKGALLMAGLVQNGSLSLLTSDDSYSSLKDLRNKKILTTSSADSALAVFQEILSKKEVTPIGDKNEAAVQFDSSLPTALSANSLIRNQNSYALLPEPFATIVLNNSSDFTRAENIQKLYAEVEEGSSYPAMLLVIRADFAKEKRDTIRRFVELYKNALLWTNHNPSKAALLIEKHKLGLSQSISRASIPHASLQWRDSIAAKSDIEKYLTILKRKLPAEEFFYKP